jgi:hypothetical protein
MISEVSTGLYADPSMKDGVVLLQNGPDLPRDTLTASLQTAATLVGEGTWGKLLDLLQGQPDGTYAVPPQLLSPPPPLDFEALEELQRGLRFAKRGYSTHCVHPPCILPASRLNDGYSLCAEHDDLLIAALTGE